MIEDLLFFLGLIKEDKYLGKTGRETTKEEKVKNIYDYYNVCLEYYLNKVRAKIADMAKEFRNDYGYWPNVVNQSYISKKISKPDYVDGLENFQYLDIYDIEKVHHTVNMCLYTDKISYDIRVELNKALNDYRKIQELIDKEEKQLNF